MSAHAAVTSPWAMAKDWNTAFVRVFSLGLSANQLDVFFYIKSVSVTNK
jgi:hypothetical protein